MIIREALKDIFKFKDYKGTFGLEIETEVKKSSDYPEDFLISEPPSLDEDEEFYEHGGFKVKNLTEHWKAEKDGSLRNYGIEYIFKKPLSLQEAGLALEKFGHYTKDIPFLPTPHTCSVHVHINMVNETFKTLGNFLTIWTLFENVLVEYSGEGRRSNLFAMPTRCAEGVVRNIVSMFNRLESGNPFGIDFSENSCKYGSVNLATLTSLGSLEVRTFRGTTDYKEIIDWIEILNKILEFSRGDITPDEILMFLRETDEGQVFKSIFQAKTDKLLEGIDLEAYVDRNLYYAGMIADSCNNWETLGENLTKKTKRRKKKTSGHGFFFGDESPAAMPEPVEDLLVAYDEIIADQMSVQSGNASPFQATNAFAYFSPATESSE